MIDVPLVLYFVAILGFFAINMRILKAIHIEAYFKKGKTWEIKAAYFIIALVIAHVLAEIVVKLFSIVEIS